MTQKQQQEAKAETKEEIIGDIEKSGIPKTQAKQEEKLDETSVKESGKEEIRDQGKKDGKKPVQKRPKKTEVFVQTRNVPVSTKHATAIGKFIKNKEISEAIFNLEHVLKMKKAVPMSGEIPHRKGRGMMSGRFPRKASESFIKLLRSLAANSEHFELENPVISSVVSNIGERPFGRFGAVRKKRTHIKITAKEKKQGERK